MQKNNSKKLNRSAVFLKTIFVFVFFLVISFSLPVQAQQADAGSVAFNGQNTIPLGWYALSPHVTDVNDRTELDETGQHGFDYVMTYAPWGPDYWVLAYLDDAQARGAKVMIDLHPADQAEVVRRVNVVKDHPALYGYYLEDEPEIRGISAQTCIDKYDAIKQADPDHPVMLTLANSLSSYPAYLQAGDIIGRELYSLNNYASRVQSDVQAAQNAGKGYLVIPRAFEPLPTPAEFRYSVFSAISAGAGGVMPFIFEGYTPGQTPPPPGHRDTIVYPATDQLNAIKPVLLKGSGALASSVQGNPVGITWVFAGEGNDAVLVAVNNNITSMPGVEFTLSGLDSQNFQGDVLGEGRTIALNANASFTDTFAPQDVHIYRFVNLPEPPTVTYTFRETTPGKWDVLVEVTGTETAGLSAYEVWVDNVDPSSISFDENVLGTVVGQNYTPIGFASGTLVQGNAGGSFNAGNFQGSGDAAIQGVGMHSIFEEGSLPGTTPLVDLGVPALLGILSTPEGLGQGDFRVTTAGLLNALGDGFLNTDSLVPMLEVIPLQWVEGDANGDGVVSAADYASVQANFGNTGEFGLIGDANGDGVVSAADYASVQANFGNTAVMVIPEPATFSLLIISGLVMLRRRRK